MPSDGDYDFDDDYGPFEEPTTDRPQGVRFGEGQPINRGGRPRGSPNIGTMVRRVALKRHRVKIEGRIRRKNTLELIALAILNKSARGDLRAFNLHQKLLQQGSAAGETRLGVLISQEKFMIDEWLAVYGFDFSDDEVEQRFPYLMRMRKDHQELQAMFDRQMREAQFGTGSALPDAM